MAGVIRNKAVSKAVTEPVTDFSVENIKLSPCKGGNAQSSLPVRGWETGGCRDAKFPQIDLDSVWSEQNARRPCCGN